MAQQPMGNQATVICLHASGSSGGQWSALRARLEPDVLVLTPDLHGHGAGPAWHGFDEDVVAADAARVARFAGTVAGEVHLVGHSYGGVIALRTALYHPERVASVTVYEPVVFRLLFDYHGRRPPRPKSSRSQATCAADCGPTTCPARRHASSTTGAAAVHGTPSRSVSKPASRNASA